MKVLRVKSVNGDTSFQNETVQISGYKKYILVSGLMYPDNKNNYRLSGDFSRYVDNYIKKILNSKNKEEKVIIYNVNILNGDIIEAEYHSDKEKIVRQIKFEKVENKDYGQENINNRVYYRYLNFNKKIISKKDIYKLIENIGKTEPNTLYEVHIFSHAYYDGPILVNTQAGENDCDMRISDIENNIINIIDFQNAFSYNGKVKIWGCSFPLATNTLYSKIRNNISYKNKDRNDSTVFKFSKNTLWFYKNNVKNTDLTTIINWILSTNHKVDEDVELTFLEIKKILAYNFLNTYSSKLALYSTIPVIAALPATYSNTTSEMKISTDTLANAKMYRDIFDIKLDEHNFGIFDYEIVNQLNALL